jgi:hypothetical protein
VFSPEQLWSPGETVTLTAGATTVSGKAIGPITKRLQIALATTKSAGEALWQPLPGVDYTPAAAEGHGEAVPMKLSAADAVPPFAEGRGEPVDIASALPFTAPQRVWLPVPKGEDPANLVVYYYHPGGANAGWYRGDRVQGWLVPDSMLQLDLEQGSYIGVTVQFGGVAQLGVPEAQAAPTQASVASLGSIRQILGDLLVFGLATAALLLKGRFRVRKGADGIVLTGK